MIRLSVVEDHQLARIYYLHRALASWMDGVALDLRG